MIKEFNDDIFLLLIIPPLYIFIPAYQVKRILTERVGDGQSLIGPGEPVVVSPALECVSRYTDLTGQPRIRVLSRVAIRLLCSKKTTYPPPCGMLIHDVYRHITI